MYPTLPRARRFVVSLELGGKLFNAIAGQRAPVELSESGTAALARRRSLPPR
jgi:hypothetical protein